MTELVPADDDLDHVELAIVEEPEILLPWNGILVNLRDPLAVAEGIRDVREYTEHLERLRKHLENVLRLEARRQGTKTLHLSPNVDAVISGGVRYSYDGEQLVRLLEAAGMPDGRIEELVTMVVSWKVDARKAKSAASANPAYAEALAKTTNVESAPWRVTVRKP